MDEAMLKSGQYPNIAIEAGTDPAEVMREHGREVIPDGEKYELADTREHEPGTRHMDNGVSVQMCPNDTGAHSNVTQILSDTRERLEADASSFCDAYTDARTYQGLPTEAYTSLIELLDRQAAITRAECKNTFVHFAERLQLVQNGYDAAVRDMQPKVDELTAERDQLSRDLTAEHALVVQFEHDNEKLRDTCNTLRASVAGLKMTVEKRKPDPVEIQAQLARFAAEWERADTAIQEQRLIACYAGKLANG